MQPAQANAGSRLDRIKVGRFHYRILFWIAAGMFLDAFDIYLAGGVLSALLKEGWSTLDKNALFVSATFVGMMIGAVGAGILGDRYGRRFSYQINLIIFGGFSFAAAAAPNMDWLIVFRFLMGIGLGAEVAIGFATITEFVPARSRGRWIGGASVIANSALPVASVLGLFIIPNLSWRVMLLIVGIGATILWFLRKNMPESPRWLERQGRTEEAKKLLDAIEAECGIDPIAPPLAPPQPVTASPPITVLFRREVLPRTILAASFNITLGVTIYGLITWLPTFFVREGVSVVSSLAFTTAMSFGGPLGAVIGLFLADRVNRRTIMGTVPLLSAALALIYPFMTHPAALMLMGFTLITSVYLWVTFGQLVQTELFDTDYRLRGTGFSSMTGRLATALVQFAVIALFASGGVLGVVGMVVAFLAAMAILYLVFGIETRQKPLEALAPRL